MHRDATENGFRIRLPRGEVAVADLGAGVVIASYSGLITGDVVAPITTAFDAVIREEGTIALFVDAETMEGYEPGFRQNFVPWLRDRRKQLEEVHILARSRIVQMGVAVANPIVGDFLRAHYERPPFEAALAAAKARRLKRRAPPAR